MRMRTGTQIFLALAVQDIDAAIAFYRDVLGMEEVKSVVVSDDKAERSGASALGFQFRIFSLGPLALKLVELKKDAEPVAGALDDFYGVRYIAFVVEDLDETYRSLQAKGVQFLSDILPAEPEANIQRLVFFRDPDGNILELYGE